MWPTAKSHRIESGWADLVNNGRKRSKGGRSGTLVGRVVGETGLCTVVLGMGCKCSLRQAFLSGNRGSVAEVEAWGQEKLAETAEGPWLLLQPQLQCCQLVLLWRAAKRE